MSKAARIKILYTKLYSKFFLLFFILSAKSIFLPGVVAWSAPLTISSAGVDASSPQVVVDQQNNATAIWIENGFIRTSNLTFNGSWSLPTTISGSTASLPKLKVDGSGNVTALWLENGIVTSASQVSQGAWTTEVAISDAGGGATMPQMCMDSSGNAVAVWVRNGVIESATRSLGAWGSVSTISSANSDYPQVAISENGTVIAVWHSVVSNADVIVSDTKSISGSWNSAKNVFSGTAALKHNYPQVAIDSQGNAVLLWFRYNLINNAYQNVTLLTSSLNQNSTNWTIPAFLSNPGIRNPADLFIKIQFDPNDNAVAIWNNSYDNQTFSIETSAKLSGMSWQLFQTLTISTYSQLGDLSIDSLGNALAVYMNWDGNNIQLQSQEGNIENPVKSFWISGNSLTSRSNNTSPSCSINLNGNSAYATAVWMSFDGANTIIQASTGSETVIQPPTGLNITQNSINFGFYKDYYNTLTWQPSPSQNIQQYNVYRNGIFFTSTNTNSLQVVDHNASQNGPVTYGVAAEDVNYLQSLMATVTFP